jgi:hypothetical protein
MEIRDLIETIVAQSPLEGKYSFKELTHRAATALMNGVGISRNNPATIMLVFSGGEPRGAIYIDEKGTLYGEKAVYLIQGTEQFEFHRAGSELVESVISRCRVYDGTHLKKCGSLDVPTFGGGTHLRPGVLCLIVNKDEIPQAGLIITVRKDKRVIATEMTSGNGRASFKLLNGHYLCVISDHGVEVARFSIDFHDRYVESVVDIGSR